jgi:hypothetical protein
VQRAQRGQSISRYSVHALCKCVSIVRYECRIIIKLIEYPQFQKDNKANTFLTSVYVMCAVELSNIGN